MSDERTYPALEKAKALDPRKVVVHVPCPSDADSLDSTGKYNLACQRVERLLRSVDDLEEALHLEASAADKLRERVEELERALKPFAQAANFIHDDEWPETRAQLDATIERLERAEIVEVRLMDAADGNHCSCANAGSFDVARNCGHLRVPHFARHGTMIVWPEEAS